MEPVPSPEVDRLRPFTVGDWLIQPKACHATRGDIQLKLRPQLVDVLVCLARRAGEIVLKDEILTEVWPDQYIAESGLSRCIAELRQILTDDAQNPRYIETIPKRGYRLIAPVVWVTPVPPDTAAQREPLGEAEENRLATGAASPPPEAPRRNNRGRLRLGRWAAWAAGAVAVAAAGSYLAGWLGRPPAVVLSERDAVLLADVNNATGNSVFDDTLRLALAVELQQAPFLRILPDEAVRAAVARMGRPPDTRVVGAVALDACRRERGSVLLAASIAPLGSRYAVGIEAIACGSGEAVARALVEADGQERVIEALERAARSIRQQLGESRASLRQHGVPLEQATTPSLEALKALTLGDRNREQARLAEALTLYREATEIDPGFALAWARRGAVARNLGLRDEMIPAFHRAYELRDRVTQPERFYIEAHYVVDTDPEQAIEVFRSWKRMYPGSYIPPNNLAALLSGQMGQYDGALADAREAVRLAPGNLMAHRTLVVACLGSGRIDEARQAIAAAAKQGIDDPHLRRLALKILLLDGGPAALEREAEQGSGDPMAELDLWRLRALAAMARGRLGEARRLWSGALERTSQTGLDGRSVEMRLSQAEAEALLGDPRAARQAVQAALAADATHTTLCTSAIVFVLIGEPVRARALLDDVIRKPSPNSGFLKVWLPSAQALIEAAQGHADRAIGIWQPIARFARGSDQALVPLGVGALAEMHAHRPAKAVALFRDLTELRAIEPASPWAAFAPLGLARALRESGDVSGSLAAYDAFLESWKEADADAPLLGVARRERAALAERGTSH